MQAFNQGLCKTCWTKGDGSLPVRPQSSAQMTSAQAERKARPVCPQGATCRWAMSLPTHALEYSHQDHATPQDDVAESAASDAAKICINNGVAYGEERSVFWRGVGGFFLDVKGIVSMSQPYRHTRTAQQASVPIPGRPLQPLPQDPTAAWQMMRVKQPFEVLETAKFVNVGPKPAGHVRFVVVSDTHDHHFCQALGHKHAAPVIPEGDVLIHAGDFTSTGREIEVAQFNAWLATLPHTHKIVIAGNHDLTFDLESYPQLWKRFHHTHMLDAARIKGSLSNCTYLQDEECEVEGIRIYGSPWQPRFCDWAFNLDRGQPLQAKWSKIPEGIDLLITHGPPIGMICALNQEPVFSNAEIGTCTCPHHTGLTGHGDECKGGHRAGCVDLLLEIQNRIKPKYHVFGTQFTCLTGT